MGLADGAVEWVTNGDALEVSSDGGSAWRAVTPPDLEGVTVSLDVTAVDAVGTDDLWVAIHGRARSCALRPVERRVQPR